MNSVLRIIEMLKALAKWGVKPHSKR